MGIAITKRVRRLQDHDTRFRGHHRFPCPWWSYEDRKA